MKTIRKLKWKAMLMLALLCFGMGFLRAQERATTVDWSGPISGRTISTPTNVYLKGDVTLNGTITVAKGAELNIYADGANRTIYRGNFNGDMFDTELGDGTLEGGILRFNRNPSSTYTITIDGGAQFQDNDAKKALLNSPNTGRAIVARGRLRMHHVIIQNIHLPDNIPGAAGAILFDSKGSKPNSTNGYYVAVSDLIIRAVKAGTVIYFFGRDHHQFGDDDGFVRVEIYNCSSLGTSSDRWGGTIRAVGGVKSNLVLNACSIHDNIAKYGGAVFWNAGNGTSCKLKIIGNTKIYNNEATENGGGISTLSTVDLQSAEIYNNRAKNGGGFCVDTYWGGNDNYSGEGFEVKIVDGVSIHDNTADERGGGIYMLFQPTNDVGFDAAGNPISPQFKFEMTGGSIYNNHAPIGAGVAIYDMAPNRHKNNNPVLQSTPDPNPAYRKWSGEYVRNVYISGGNIYDNTPESESTDTKGAGMYIAKAVAADVADGTIGYTYGTEITEGGVVTGVVTAGSITINPTGGNIYGNQANNGSGSGMYIVDEMNNVSPYYSVCNVNVGAVNIYGNTCSGDGAGMYVQNGIVTVSGAKIGVTSTGASSANTATGLGGGIYVNNTQPGVVTTINGGTKINNNGASNGAGAYIAQGKVVVQDASTEIASNTASTTGGGIYVANGNLELTNANVNSNKATSGNGGGAYIANGEVTIDNATLSGNQATAGNGGGICINSSSATNPIDIKNGTKINGTNEALNGAGVYVAQGAVTIEGTTTQISGNQATQNGGGIYMNTGTVTVTNAKVEGNVAKTAEGGGIYVGNGGGKATSSITLDGATVDGNEAATSGGGIYVAGNVTLQNDAIVKANEAVASGGGIYVADGGTFTMTGGTVGGTTAEGNKATGANGAGGGLFMAGGTATISGGDISGNSATMNGGGIFMDGRETGVAATCTLSDGANIGKAYTIEGTDTTFYANTARYGGGIYSAGGTITVKGGQIKFNKATIDGGGIYTSGTDGVVNVERQDSKATALSYIERNTATNGGGIYCNLGRVNFSDGFIQHNHATAAGGGIYVNENGILELKGSATLHLNNVPKGHDGGGVYLLGSLTVGDTGNIGRIMAQTNYAGNDGYKYEWTDHGGELDSINYVTENNRNNVFLPAPVAHPYTSSDHRGVIKVIQGGINVSPDYGVGTRVGFSVEHGNVPVIYCDYNAGSDSRTYLHQFSTGFDGQYVLFDDARRYIAKHLTNAPDIFDPDHVYLYGYWSNVVTGSDDDPECQDFDPTTFDPMDINSPCALAYFISWVNGLNNVTSGNPNADARLTADIDMSGYGWVPLDNYGGHFDGGGHTITGINSLLYGEYDEYGFFGSLNGGSVTNLYVKDAQFYLEDNGDMLYIGGLAGEVKSRTVGGKTFVPVIENTEVSSTIYAENPNAVMGGLVGRMDAGKIHSSIGIPTMIGNTMGGLVGELVGDSLVNSFANAKFTSESNAKYQGGLVAVNGGLVENCYFHEQEGSSHGTLFGTLVGNNIDSVKYCYAGSQKVSPYEAPTALYIVQGKSPKGHGFYADNTETPYLYRRRDNQVSIVGGTNPYLPVRTATMNPDVTVDQQMLYCLNNWVEDNSGTTTYTKWARPTTKVINDDLPLLLMPSPNAVAATTGDPYLEYGSANSRIESFRTSQQAIYMYRTQTDSVVGNGGSDAGLYIDEHVALIQKGELKAHVGITLDNSAGRYGAQPTFGGIENTSTFDYTDWHMFATPLADVPLGIKYVKNDGVTEDDTQWGLNGNHYHDAHENGMPYYQFLDNDYDGEQGYFPSHAYGTTYSNDNSGPTTGGSYYQEWDFYCYYEPEYHWINFKRNGKDHWHENAHDVQIEYKPYGYSNVTNEEYLIPGKGYLVATREPNTFLQAEGTLNNGTVSIAATRLGYYSKGYNLMGNPYQAYLDFDRFAQVNKDLWGDLTDSDIAKPSYYIIDEDSTRYITYVQGGSPNPSGAGRFIHPHQGFMILLGERGGGEFIFAPTMRNIDATGVNFRGESQPAYPLVNLFATEQNGNSSMTTVELGRPDKGGAPVLRDMHVSRGKLYCRYEGEDYAIAFTQPGLTEAAIRFETLEDADYTMTWNTHNGEFSYLHLIDNLTGADVDCLAESEYRFTSKTTDYKSRFRLVFGYTGIDEPGDDGAPTGTAANSFAFQMGDQLVVNGEGTLQVFDMAGRQVMSTETHGTQTTVSLPGMAAGVYTMRLTNTRSTQVQKIVIR